MNYKKRSFIALLALVTLVTFSQLLFGMKRKRYEKYSSCIKEIPAKKRKIATNITNETKEDELYNIFLQRKKYQTAILYMQPKSCSPVSLDLTQEENFLFAKKYFKKSLDISQNIGNDAFLYDLFKRKKKQIIAHIPVAKTKKSIKTFLELARIRTLEENLPIKHHETKYMSKLSEEEVTEMLDIESFLGLNPLNS